MRMLSRLLRVHNITTFGQLFLCVVLLHCIAVSGITSPAAIINVAEPTIGPLVRRIEQRGFDTAGRQEAPRPRRWGAKRCTTTMSHSYTYIDVVPTSDSVSLTPTRFQPSPRRSVGIITPSRTASILIDTTTSTDTTTTDTTTSTTTTSTTTTTTTTTTTSTINIDTTFPSNETTKSNDTNNNAPNVTDEVGGMPRRTVDLSPSVDTTATAVTILAIAAGGTELQTVAALRISRCAGGGEEDSKGALRALSPLGIGDTFEGAVYGIFICISLGLLFNTLLVVFRCYSGLRSHDDDLMNSALVNSVAMTDAEMMSKHPWLYTTARAHFPSISLRVALLFVQGLFSCGLRAGNPGVAVVGIGLPIILLVCFPLLARLVISRQLYAVAYTYHSTPVDTEEEMLQDESENDVNENVVITEDNNDYNNGDNKKYPSAKRRDGGRLWHYFSLYGIPQYIYGTNIPEKTMLSVVTGRLRLKGELHTLWTFVPFLCVLPAIVSPFSACTAMYCISTVLHFIMALVAAYLRPLAFPLATLFLVIGLILNGVLVGIDTLSVSNISVSYTGGVSEAAVVMQIILVLLKVVATVIAAIVTIMVRNANIRRRISFARRFVLRVKHVEFIYQSPYGSVLKPQEKGATAETLLGRQDDNLLDIPLFGNAVADAVLEEEPNNRGVGAASTSNARDMLDNDITLDDDMDDHKVAETGSATNVKVSTDENSASASASGSAADSRSHSRSHSSGSSLDL